MMKTPSMVVDLLDINVWLALADENHQHHCRARLYWEKESAARLAFCRVTMLGFLRLATHPRAMNGHPLFRPGSMAGLPGLPLLAGGGNACRTREPGTHFRRVDGPAGFPRFALDGQLSGGPGPLHALPPCVVRFRLSPI